ncbi:MAG: VanZ family protein [Coprococcus sp.]
MDNKNNHQLLYRMITAVFLLAWILFIFHNSMENSELSSSRSLGLLAVLERYLGESSFLTEHLLRKLAHFTEFAAEGVLLLLMLRGYTDRVTRYMGWPLLGGLLTALTDETLQLFSDGRSSQVTDVWIDFSGVLAGVLTAAVIVWWKKKRNT